MQKQIGESICFLLSQRLKRFIKLQDDAALLILIVLENTVVFHKNILLRTIHNGFIIVLHTPMHFLIVHLNFEYVMYQ